jgi:hypothetical protein
MANIIPITVRLRPHEHAAALEIAAERTAAIRTVNPTAVEVSLSSLFRGWLLEHLTRRDGPSPLPPLGPATALDLDQVHAALQTQLDAGILQKQLAELAKMDPRAISRFWDKKKIQPDQLERLAVALRLLAERAR